MKHVLILLLASLVANGLVAQNNVAWKDKVVGTWRYDGTEEFGVVTAADSTHAEDRLEINADGTFRWKEQNKESNGTFRIDEAAKTITFKETEGKPKMYFLKKSDPGVLLIEFQTPDLVRTRHRFSAIR